MRPARAARLALDSGRMGEHYPDHLRRIRFHDPETGETLVFLTNNTTLLALTIAALYKSRWQIECSSMDQAAPANQAIPRHQ